MKVAIKKIQGYRGNLVLLFSRRRIWTCLLMGSVVLLALLYIRFALTVTVDHDEVENAHVSFKMLNGKIPYRDFYQNHMPAYWILGMYCVRAFPFSIHAILAERVVNLLALIACWFLGLRLLGTIRGGRTWFGISIYTCITTTLACTLEFHEARPDPIMALLGTLGLCLIPARGYISSARSLLLGIIFGLSISVSPKILPMVLVVPALITWHCIRDRRLRTAATLFPYGLGIISGLLPTIFWIVHNGLFDDFFTDVFLLNNALSKSWYLSLDILRIPSYLISALGTVVLLGMYKRRSNRLANRPLVLFLAMIAGMVLAFLERHPARYNLQILIVPIAVGFVGFVLHLGLRRRLSYQLLLCAALLGYPTSNIASSLVGLHIKPGSMSLDEFQKIMDLAGPGDRTCIAFAPSHPIFCHDISGLSNGWDLTFAEQIKNPQMLERFHRLWREGIRNTIDRRPDIILRRSPANIWEHAVREGLISQAELHELDELRTAYEVRHIGNREFWIRR